MSALAHAILIGLLAASAALPQSAPAREHSEKALQLRRQGDLPGAFKEFRQAGLILLEQRNFARAAEAFRAAVQIDPKDTDVRYNLALSLANAGRRPEGIAEIQEILHQKPSWALAFFGLGHIYTLEGKPALAEQSFRTALSLDPRLLRGHFELGKLLEQAGDRAGAIREFEAATRISPDFAAARYRLAKLLQQSGNTERSVAELAAMREAMDRRAKGEQAALAYKKGLEQLEQGDPEAAVRELQRAVELRPDFTEILGALAESRRQWGMSLEAHGNLPAALEQFGKSLAIEPDAETHNHLGVLFAKSGNVDAAIEHFRSALSLRPGFRNAETNLRQALQIKQELTARRP